MLADEINRATPKTQSALRGHAGTHRDDRNDQPSAAGAVSGACHTKSDRKRGELIRCRKPSWTVFLFKVLVKFPDRQELRGNRGTDGGKPSAKDRKGHGPGKACFAARACVAHIPIADAVMDYILDLVMATHADNPYIREGASPRAAQALIRTARARAFMENRLNVSFEDVKCVALPVLRHRILLSFDAVSEGITEDAVIGQILTEKEQGLYA